MRLVLDPNGWIETQKLLDAFHKKGFALSFENLEYVVANNDKKRFAFNEDKTKIRASQGHSVKIDLALQASAPPQILFHGTIQQNLASIQEKGLLKGKRNHVHLSKDEETAQKVGARHGKNIVILKVKTAEMHEKGFAFFLSENGIWLSDHVPSEFIDLPNH